MSCFTGWSVTLTFANGAPFADSWARFSEESAQRAGDARKIYARVRDGGRPNGLSFLAMVDTGAAWTHLHHELAEALGLFDEDGEPAKISTSRGAIDGLLVKCPIILCADHGPELTVHATVHASKAWDGPNILGYSGLLAHLRFAFEPAFSGSTLDQPRWFFGPPG